MCRKRDTMENLMEAIDTSLKARDLPPISDVVNNREKCVQYIKRILKKYDNKVVIPFDQTLEKYDFRVKHVLFSFGLGFVLSRFCNLEQAIDDRYGKNYKIDDPFTYVWLTLCLYHDFGYFIGPQYVKNKTLQSIAVDYDIFRTYYCSSRYSEKLYRAYYERKYRTQLENKSKLDLNQCEEVGDHGILGGYVLFQKLCASEETAAFAKTKAPIVQNLHEGDSEAPIRYHRERLPLYQDICFRIMEHNIWKEHETVPLSDPFREIDADHFQNISREEPLLFLLCLVDTIEMTKRFCRYPDSSSEKNRERYPKTLGSKIQIKVSDDEIAMEYHKLKEAVKSKDIQSWIESITGLSDWVQVDTGHTEPKGVLRIFSCSPVENEILYSPAVPL